MANDIVVDGGLTEILERLLNLSSTSALFIAVGGGNTAPVAGDTQLGTETARVQVSTKVVQNNVATIKAFFNTSQGNGSVGEHGLFVEASGGRMIDRGIEVPIQSKSATQEMIVEKVITLERG